MTFSPGLAPFGDTTKATQTVSATLDLTGCVGLGVTSGAVTYSGKSSIPTNCATIADYVGTEVITWNTGQTSSLAFDSPLFPPTGVGTVTSGLFSGSSYSVNFFDTGNPGSCATTALTSATLDSASNPEFNMPAGLVTCASAQPCNKSAATSATAEAPGLKVTATGSPAAGAGTVSLTIASGTLTCPSIAPSVRPVANLTDSGFAPTDRLTVTAMLPLASSTSAEQVCFHSTVPFKSRSNVSIKKAGTALLLPCTQVANVAPCVQSSKQVGSNVLVTFAVPGGDPTFTIVPPTGRELWASTLGQGTVGNTYSAHFATKGGKAPFRWSVASGSLPPGCTLNPTSGTVTGKPTRKGTYKAVIEATDSEKPHKDARLPVPFTIR